MLLAVIRRMQVVGCGGGGGGGEWVRGSSGGKEYVSGSVGHAAVLLLVSFAQDSHLLVVTH